MTHVSDSPSVIVDVGSGFLKAGLQTDSNPTCIYPTLVGRPRRRYAAELGDENRVIVGDEAIGLRQQLSFSYPVDHGHIQDWCDLEALFQYIYSTGLGIDTRGGSVLISIPPLASATHQEHLVESMLEVFEFSEINLSIQGVLALYAAGRTTGLVVEIGEGVTQIVPVNDGYASNSAIRRNDLGGQEVTMYLQKLLCDRGYQISTRDDIEIVRMIKETLCYVSLNPLEEDSRGSSDLKASYTLPDGMCLKEGISSIDIEAERFYCPEVFFEPRIIHRDCPSLPELIWQAIQSSPIETRKASLGSVILSGGSTLFPGFEERLCQDLQQMAPPQARNAVKIVAQKDRLFGVWLGARLFCSPGMRPIQSELWISKDEWLDFGPSIIPRKARLGDAR